jgi:hypothetical protein
MSLTVIPISLLLPFEAVRLGRLVKSIDQPLEGYHEPFPSESPTPVVSQFDYAEKRQQASRASFGSSLTALFSAAFSKRSFSQVHVEPRCLKTYALDNSDAWFNRAISHDETKRWIERAAIRGNKIFMIVGIWTLTDTHFLQTFVKEHDSQGQVAAPVSLSLAAAGAVVPLADLVDPSAHGDFGSFASSGTRIFAPGEQICAIQYRKIGYKWLSSRVMKNLQLSKTRQWFCVEGDKRGDVYENEDDDDEDNEDVIEVDITDAENLDDAWTAAESDKGLIYVRS